MLFQWAVYITNYRTMMLKRHQSYYNIILDKTLQLSHLVVSYYDNKLSLACMKTSMGTKQYIGLFLMVFLPADILAYIKV